MDELEVLEAKLKALQSPTAADADPKAIDPGTIVVIVDAILKLIEYIRKRRAGG